MLSIKEIDVVVHVTLVKPNVIQKLGGMNTVIQPKFQNQKNSFKVTATIVLLELSFQEQKSILKGLEASFIAPYEADLSKKKDFESFI